MDDPTPRPLRRETKCTYEAPVPSWGLVFICSTANPGCAFLGSSSPADRVHHRFEQPSRIHIVRQCIVLHYSYNSYIEPRAVPPGHPQIPF